MGRQTHASTAWASRLKTACLQSHLTSGGGHTVFWHASLNRATTCLSACTGMHCPSFFVEITSVWMKSVLSSATEWLERLTFYPDSFVYPIQNWILFFCFPLSFQSACTVMNVLWSRILTTATEILKSLWSIGGECWRVIHGLFLAVHIVRPDLDHLVESSSSSSLFYLATQGLIVKQGKTKQCVEVLGSFELVTFTLCQSWLSWN